MLFLFMKTTTKGNSDSSSSCDGVGYGEPRNRVAQNGQEDLNPSVAQVSSLITIEPIIFRTTLMTLCSCLLSMNRGSIRFVSSLYLSENSHRSNCSALSTPLRNCVKCSPFCIIRIPSNNCPEL